MTFEESLEQVDVLSVYGAVGLAPETARLIIKSLQQEYAPTVDMTEKQYHSFKLWKYHTAGWNMTNCAEWARDENITASDAMQAWLHPECIKVINEEKA